MMIFVIALSLTITGEALALFIGMYFVNKKREWFITRNIVFISLDVVTGIGIFYLSISGKPVSNIIFSELVIAAAVAHLLRSVEYFSKRKIKFCFNIPLFVVNNIKLIGLILVYILGF
jgi:hypothetical protein